MQPEKVTSINTLEKPTEASDRILRGVNFLCDAVKQTLGPYGRNFLLQKGVKITNDGISIAKEIQLKDEIEDLALRIAREAAVKTNDEAGDGTTTALTLTQAVLEEAFRLLPGKKLVGKKSVIQVRKQIAEECKEVVAKLTASAKKVESREELIQIATVALQDKALAELIGGVQWDLGPEGTIIPEESNDTEDSVERIHGIRIDNGFGTSLMVNDQEKQRLVVENVRVLMTTYTIQSLSPMKKALDALIRQGFKEIVIVGRAFSEVAIQECMRNHEGGIKLYPINAPYINQVQIMKDLEAVLGGKYCNHEELDLEGMTIADAGFAQKVIGQRWNAIFTGKNDEQAETRVARRIEILEKELEGEKSKFAQKALQGRLAQLKNGFALVKITGLTDTDRKYKFDKAEDGVNAVKSAYQEGTVKGGGLALKEISEGMPDDAILKRPLLAPYQQIMANAGEDFAIEDWVRNSLKVERVALENACQIAADLATAGGAIATEKGKPKFVQEVDK